MLQKITEAEINERSMARVSTTPGRATGFGENNLGPEALKLRFDRLGRFLASKINEILGSIEDGSIAEYIYVDHNGNKISVEQFITNLLNGDVDNIQIKINGGIVYLTEIAMKTEEMYNGLFTGDIAGKIAVVEGITLKRFYEDFLKFEANAAPVKSVNGQTGHVQLSAPDINAEVLGTAQATTERHNTSDASHADIRRALANLVQRLDALANSEDTDLDQLKEIVAYIKENKNLIDGITASKVNVSDIIDNLETNLKDKPLSASQGVALKNMIAEITPFTKLSELDNDVGFITENDVPVRNVNGKTGEVTLDASDVGAEAAGTVNQHNADTAAHNDLRLLIQGLTARLNALANSDDTDLDQLKEIVAYIKLNKDLIDGITTSKVNVADIIDNLTTNVTDKPLSAAQGVALKAFIDALQSGKLNASELSTAINTALAQAKASGKFDGADGKSAYEYAQDGGYTGTTEDFSKKLADEWALADDVFELTETPLFENVFDTVGIEYGKYLNSDGTVTDSAANIAAMGFIPVKPNDIIRVNEDFKIYPTGSPRVVLCDASKVAVQSVGTSTIQEGGYYIKLLKKDAEGNILEFQILRPATTAFMRISNSTTIMGNNPILTINEEIKYKEQYGYLLNPKIRVKQSQIINAPQKNGWSILPKEHIGICYSGINRKPINTAEHFTDAATNFGYNALKCDVRPTSDNELICCHDAGFTFDGNGYITTYDSANQTLIRNVTSATCLNYSFKTGEHPCLVGDYLKICRTYGKVAFITIRNEYMDVVIPKLLEELKKHNMMYSSIINCMTYESLVTWRKLDKDVMINYTLSYGNAIDKAAIDKAVSLGYCSLCGFSLNSSQLEPTAECDFEYARECGIRVGQAIAYKEGSPEKCFEMGYDLCHIGIPWKPIERGLAEDDVSSMINNAIGSAIGGAY